MKYIKLFESFMQAGEAGPATIEPGPSSLPETKPGQRFSVEETPLYAAVLDALNKRLATDSEFANLYDELERKLSRNKDVYSIFVDTEYVSSLIDAELPKYKMTSERYRRFFESNMPNPDLQKMAKDALINIGLLGALGLAIKLFYMLGEMLFTQLNQSGFSSVAGGVVLILIYLAFFKKAKKSNNSSDDDTSEFEINEKRSRKERFRKT
jgi:hypothetical protein